jgi:serine protease SohB
MPFSSRKWHKIVKGMGPERQKRKNEEPPTPSRTVVVIELDTQKNQDSTFSDFADMVSFLASANGRNKQIFGSEPEVILNIFSSGGEVTSFALAAAHVKRLRMAGWKVTACVDRFAASGGYVSISSVL